MDGPCCFARCATSLGLGTAEPSVRDAVGGRASEPPGSCTSSADEDAARMPLGSCAIDIEKE